MNSFFRILPEQAAVLSKSVDALYLFMVGISIFFTVLVVVLVVTFAIKYRKKDGREPEAVHGHLVLELVWTGIPLVLVIFMFVWGTLVYFKGAHIPENAKEIFIVGKQWMWKIQHGEGPREMNELHVPVNQPIKLVITSEDVIHSVYAPAFRMKMDAVPGRYTFAGFEATQPGKYHLFCAEYCGTKHSEMIGWIYVLSQEDYQKWLTERIESPVPGSTQLSSEEPKVRGEKLFTEKTCITCHGATTGALGPDLANLFGSDVILQDGRKVKADETYLRRSILTPSEEVVKGYSALMPTFKGQLDEEQIIALIEYIKSLKKN